MEEAGRLKKREGSEEVAPKLLEEFNREVEDKGPCARHKKVQKALGKYLATNGGPLKRKLECIRGEHEIGDWPADVYAEWDSLPSPEVVEIEMNAVHKGQGGHLVVNYGSIEDALTKLGYIEKNGAIAEGEARGVRKWVEHLRRNGATASRFAFRPPNDDVVNDLVREKGWAKYRSALTKTFNRKIALARRSKLVSFCVPYEQYRDVLKEIKAVPEMRVAFIYPFKEYEDGIKIGAIPVFQRVSPKSYLKRGKEKQQIL